MKHAKKIVLLLLILLLIQYVYFGTEHCDKCDFEGERMGTFFKEYTRECLTPEDINISEVIIEKVDKND